MLRRITLVAASVAALSLSAHAFAVTAQSGVYVGAAGGWSFSKDYTTSSVSATSSTNKNYTFGANLGYDYALNQNVLVGAEAGYLNFGKTTYSSSSTADLDVKNSGYQILATSTYLMSNGFNGFVKAGAIKQKEDADISVVNVSESESKWLPATVLGVGYMPMQNLNVALQWEHTFGDNNTNAATDTST
ncbi:MAG: meta-pathway of phenol degradation family protein, partial [Gammaproteobacteria bacterium]|nr:meta-pathway of phenol degradation family protein [Gammaproteobacteria bacterium]